MEDRADAMDYREIVMSAEIVHFIPRPKHKHEQTDFPTIAFRLPARSDDLSIDHADAAPCEYVAPDASET